MRAPKRHVAKDGTVSWKVRYRSTTGTEKSETFYDEDQANEFAGVLNALGAVRAIEWLDEQQKEDAKGASLTFGELWAKWYEWKTAKRPDGSPLRVKSWRTTKDYAGQYQRRIEPRFASTPVEMIGSDAVQDWIDELSSEVEAKTVADYHALLHAVFKWAVSPKRRLCINDPCAETELPERIKKGARGIRPDEWQILYAAAVEVDPDAADLLLFFLGSQWRWSEAIACQAGAVEHWVEYEQLADGVEREVSYTYVHMGRVLRREGSGFAFGEDGKSHAAKRTVRLTGIFEEVVRRRIEGKQPDDLIFTTKNGGRWNYAHFHQRIWTRPKNKKNDHTPNRPRILEVAAANGFDRPEITLHWLRHTGVAWLLIAGEPMAAVSRRVGHASIKTTVDVYGRLVDDTSHDGLSKLDAMASGRMGDTRRLGRGPVVRQLPPTEEAS